MKVAYYLIVGVIAVLAVIALLAVVAAVIQIFIWLAAAVIVIGIIVLITKMFSSPKQEPPD